MFSVSIFPNPRPNPKTRVARPAERDEGGSEDFRGPNPTPRVARLAERDEGGGEVVHAAALLQVMPGAGANRVRVESIYPEREPIT
eukprot:7414678-Pyramimonas_sp.AAC.1